MKRPPYHSSPRPDKQLPAIQVLRGIAASMVVFHHFARIFQHGRASWIYNSGLGNLGMSGVDIFFVISGFIMVYTTQGKSGLSDALTFIKRRSIRIYPLYWTWTTVLLVLYLTRLARLQPFSRMYLVRSYFLIPTFNGFNFHPFINQGWTLSFEMLFYVVFCLTILAGLPKGRLAFLSIVFAALLIAGRALSPGSGIRALIADPIIVEFLYGVFAAQIVLHQRQRPGERSSLLPVILFVGGGTALLTTTAINNADSYRFALYGIPAFCIVLGAALLGSRRAPAVLVYLGDCSYSIYLVHVFFAMTYASALEHHPQLSKFPADAAIVLFGSLTIALSSSTYRLVERPMTRFFSRGRSVLPEDAPVATASAA